jgi:hypothetical protein
VCAFSHRYFCPPFSYESARDQEIYFRFCVGLPCVFPSACTGTQLSHAEYEFLTAAVMNSSAFWDKPPCNPLKINRRFGGTCCLNLHGRKISQERNQHEADSWRWRRYVPPKRRLIISGLYGVTSHKI